MRYEGCGGDVFRERYNLERLVKNINLIIYTKMLLKKMSKYVKIR